MTTQMTILDGNPDDNPDDHPHENTRLITEITAK
jgi:hypothetical protein